MDTPDSDAPVTTPFRSGSLACAGVLAALVAGCLWLLVAILVGYKEPKL